MMEYDEAIGLAWTGKMQNTSRWLYERRRGDRAWGPVQDAASWVLAGIQWSWRETIRDVAQRMIANGDPFYGHLGITVLCERVALAKEALSSNDPIAALYSADQ